MRTNSNLTNISILWWVPNFVALLLSQQSQWNLLLERNSRFYEVNHLSLPTFIIVRMKLIPILIPNRFDIGCQFVIFSHCCFPLLSNQYYVDHVPTFFFFECNVKIWNEKKTKRKWFHYILRGPSWIIGNFQSLHWEIFLVVGIYY